MKLPRGADLNDLQNIAGPNAVDAKIRAAFEPFGGFSGSAASVNADRNGPDATTEGHPTIDKVAYHGLAGEFVRTIEPETEADPVALLAQFVVAFGALVGRGPHYRVEGDEHHANLFVLLVGDTSKARKGTAWGRVRAVFERVEGWPGAREGLSSGEGLKWHVRDPIKRYERDKKSGELREVEEDPGIEDKRLLIVESEFAQVLRQAERSGNTLSAVIRSAWDKGHLATLTKNDPVTATGAHISIIGHITTDELRHELSATDVANGFANRFIFLLTRRSKMLPFGGKPLSEQVANDIARRLSRAASQARTFGQVTMTEKARKVWAEIYPDLSADRPGLLGAVTARAEAQCVRLALVYALLDGSPQIDAPHIHAALALWEYAEASARYIFGQALGNPLADKLLEALRAAGPRGLTRSAMCNLFARNESAERITAALALLERHGLARRSNPVGSGIGRPVEVWVCT